MQHSHFDLIVLGAGISGLTLAAELQRGGHKVAVIEKDAQPGGVLQSLSHGNFLWDRAAHTLAVDPELKSILEIHDLLRLLEKPSDISKVRRLAINGSLHEVSNHPGKIIGAKFLSLGAKLGLLRELFKKSINLPNPTVYEFFHHHFGEEITRNIISAVFAGIYAGDIEKMEMKSVMKKVYDIEQRSGSLIRGLIQNKDKFAGREIYGVKGGMSKLGEALAARLEHVYYDCEVTHAGRSGTGFQLSSANENFTCDKLISTIPAYAAAGLFSQLNSELSSLLGKIQYEPMVLIHVAFPSEDCANTPSAFGFLCGQYSSPVLKGAIFNSDLFPGRIPASSRSFTIFMKPELKWLDNEEILQEKVDETIGRFKTLTYIKSDPLIAETTVWRKAIPQLNVPYSDIKSAMMNEVAKVDGLHLSGSYVSGVSVTDCMKYNHSLAASLR